MLTYKWIHAPKPIHVLMHGAYPIDKISENYVRKFRSDL
jgi:hypothetical protein